MLMSNIFKFLKQPILILFLTFLVSCGDPLANLPGGSRDTPDRWKRKSKEKFRRR